MSTPTLKLRIDEFSWKGICEQDDRVFFRRLQAPDDHVFSDILIGDLQPEMAANLLADFISRTGPISSTRVEATDIASGNDSNDLVVSRYDTVVWLLTTALRSSNLQVTNAWLQPRRGKFDATLELG